MRYVLLIHGSEQAYEELTDEMRAEMYRGHDQFGSELGVLGKIQGGAELQSAATAKLVRHRGGEVLTSDGPFIETKEQLGGFYIIEADDIEEAIQWAAKIPGTDDTTIEVRPVVMH